MKVNNLFDWSDIKETAEKSGICPHFLRELNNNFNDVTIEDYDYSHVMGRTL